MLNYKDHCALLKAFKRFARRNSEFEQMASPKRFMKKY
jgi:hypothetical protein